MKSSDTVCNEYLNYKILIRNLRTKKYEESSIKTDSYNFSPRQIRKSILPKRWFECNNIPE